MGMMIDAASATQKAVNLLLAKKLDLKMPTLEVVPLQEFLDTASKQTLSLSQKLQICEQAVILLEQFYAHLPFKRARYAVDPIQSILLLKESADIKDDITFHAEITKAFTQLRDVHTVYKLPEPFRSAIAFLPFFVEYFYDEGVKKYVVTEVIADFNPDPTGAFGVYTEIVAFNGIPIDLAVTLLAKQIAGGNEATRSIRGAVRLTVRSLSTSIPPAERVAFVEYLARTDDGKLESRTIAVPWHVGKGILERDLKSEAKTPGNNSTSNSVCEPLADLAVVKSVLWQQHVLLPGGQDSYGPEAYVFSDAGMNSKLEVHHSRETLARSGELPWSELLSKDGKRFGYIRIRSFDVDFRALRDEFLKILHWFNANQYATDGLILDVRSNPGGSIVDAECLLQFLTPKPITPALFHYPNTPAVQKILQQLRDVEATQENLRNQGEPLAVVNLALAEVEFRNWVASKTHGVGSGSFITGGQNITSFADANDVGQIYQGPVTLLIDAASYSATDIFAGGFQDHNIGKIIGVDANTGGGGAKLWKHSQEVQNLAPLVEMGIQKMATAASFTTAVCRSSRVLGNLMEPVEDFGVKCDIHHKLTFDDITRQSKDLLAKACNVLASVPSHRLVIHNCERTPAGLRVTASANKTIERLACLVDGIPEYVAQIRAGGIQTHQPEAVNPGQSESVAEWDNLGLVDCSFLIPSERLDDKPMHVELRGFTRLKPGSKPDLVASSRFNLAEPQAAS